MEDIQTTEWYTYNKILEVIWEKNSNKNIYDFPYYDKKIIVQIFKKFREEYLRIAEEINNNFDVIDFLANEENIFKKTSNYETINSIGFVSNMMPKELSEIINNRLELNGYL